MARRRQNNSRSLTDQISGKTIYVGDETSEEQAEFEIIGDTDSVVDHTETITDDPLAYISINDFLIDKNKTKTTRN